jgi:hypothetical protein
MTSGVTTRTAAATLAAVALAAPSAVAMPSDPPTRPPTQRDVSALDATPSPQFAFGATAGNSPLCALGQPRKGCIS